MRGKREANLFPESLLMCIAIFSVLIAVGAGSELSESESLFSFIRAVDPQNTLNVPWNDDVVPCQYLWESKGVKCNPQATTITEIRLESLNLSGTIDADSLCKLRNLRVLTLADNLITGSIPDSLAFCTSLAYLNLSNNLLGGKVPVALSKLKSLVSLDISNNHLESGQYVFMYSMKSRSGIQIKSSRMLLSSPDPPESSKPNNFMNFRGTYLFTWIPLILGIGFFLLFIYFVSKRASRIAKDREILKSLHASPFKVTTMGGKEEANQVIKPEERSSELVFFNEESERFRLEDLLEAAADLRSQSLCSSLYKVILKNNATYAVKRLKKLQVSCEEFSRTMWQIGNLKHPNILPLVGFNATNEEKLLIYKYQSNGSLLNLLQNYIEGKNQFPWGLRLSIAGGIARGLDFIYQRTEESIPHGNLKLSNILLNEHMDPMISEYGFSRFLEANRVCFFPTGGYTAPERSISEQGDMFSFGVILLELLTGKTVEKSGIDLPRWVRSMVREEWTGEVFDKEVSNSAKQYAFPLLNVALKCISQVPDNRPTAAEVLERIEEVLHAFDDNSVSSVSSSLDSGHHECCVLHTVIPDTWDTPGSNY